MDQRQKQQPWIWLSTAFLETFAVMDALRRDEQIPLTERERERVKTMAVYFSFRAFNGGDKVEEGSGVLGIAGG